MLLIDGEYGTAPDAVDTAVAKAIASAQALIAGRHALRTPPAAVEDVHSQCGRELCALARVNMSGSQEPSRSFDDDPLRTVVAGPPAGGSRSA
jgi:hypothetical protein